MKIHLLFNFSKIPTFRTKNALFGYFLLEFEKKIAIFKNQRPRICEAAMFGAKKKILKFEIKNILIGCVGQQF